MARNDYFQQEERLEKIATRIKKLKIKEIDITEEAGENPGDIQKFTHQMSLNLGYDQQLERWKTENSRRIKAIQESLRIGGLLYVVGQRSEQILAEESNLEKAPELTEKTKNTAPGWDPSVWRKSS